jgi:dihydroorotase
MTSYDLILRNGIAVTPNGTSACDIGVRDGRIAALGVHAAASAGEVFDAAGLHILPGVIDSHVHFREPGLTHKEDFETGSRSALLGGVTTVFEMPNSAPPVTTAEGHLDKLRRAEGRMACDYAFYMGASSENAGFLGDLERLPGCSGVKVFMGASTGSLLVADDETLRRVLRSTRRRLAIHAEDEDRLQQRKPLAIDGRPETHPVWRDAETALRATQRIVALARETRRQVHILHMTTAEETAFLPAHRGVATCEATVNHLTLAAPDCYERLGVFAQMNPPVREASHRDALWAAIRSGLIDCIGSDHAPHTRQEKTGVYPQTPSGMPGVQTLVPVMLTHVAEGQLTLERLADLTSGGPARVFGIANKGRIAEGCDADFTLVDLAARRTIRNADLGTRIGWSQFDGFEAKGWPMATTLRGRMVMRDGEVLGAASGKPVGFV